MTETLAIEKHFVTFYSPGTFVAEETQKPICGWDTGVALDMMKTIEERYGARPYGFRFSTRRREVDELDSREIAASPMYYVDVKVETLQEVEQRNDPNEHILRANMRYNGYDRIATTTKGWRWTQPLKADDVILAS